MSAPARPLQQAVPWVTATQSLLELLERLGRLAVHALRHRHLDRDQQVAGRPIAAAGAPAAHPHGAAVRRAGRNAYRYRDAVVRGHLDLGAEHRLGEGDGDRDGQVVAGPAEDRMRCDVDLHVQVAGRPATLARGALALEPDPLAILNACGDARLDRAGAHRTAAASTSRARVVHDEPAATAFPARLGDAETAEVPAGLAGSLTGRADPGHGARLRARAMAGGAGALAGEPQRNGDAVDCVAERQRRLGLHVGAAAGPLLGAAAAAEHAAEQVAEPTAGSLRAEQVAEIETAEAATRTARRAEAVRAEQRPRLVVLLTPLLVGQHVVRLGDLLEALLRLAVPLVGIRMVLAGQFPV